MRAKPTGAARLEFRLPSATKELIVSAAAACGQTFSEFAQAALMQHARRALEAQRITELSNRDREAFMAMLDAPPEPTEALVRAVRRAEGRG